MSRVCSFALLIISIYFCISVVVADSDQGILENISNVSLAVPTTGTAVLGLKESMAQFQNWLTECAVLLMDYANTILKLFGFKGMNWGGNIPASQTISPRPSAQQIPVQTARPAIPESPRLMTIGTITGGSGFTNENISVPFSYWELWYTVDPIITGGQNVHSATGSYSAVFPAFSIQITDINSGKVIDIVEPPGGLDITLWERAGDPRPWYKKYYKGNTVYNFMVTGKSLKSFTIEVRVPVTTNKVSGS
jgi:hypothetical protein